jgi:type I restriction enzyme, S subunit
MTDKNGELPKGWKWVRLEDVCEIVGGNTLPEPEDAQNEDKVYCLKVSDLDGDYSDGKILSGGLLYTQRNLAGNRILSPEAIVFPKRGGAIATNKKRILSVYAVLDPNLMGIEVKSTDILSSFLYLWFESWDLASLQSGNTVPQINRQDLVSLRIPLPPLPEQKRIVAILNEQMAAVEKARVAAEAQLNTIKQLPAALLRQAFNGEL